VLDWSPDGRNLLVRESISVNETYLWSFDAVTGASSSGWRGSTSPPASTRT